MAEYDLVIRGGTIVDGTGIPQFKADLATKNGRIALISGTIKGGGAKEIDASGCIVAPGVIDMHTHYDGQVQWDPYCSLSGWFGVTSVSIGQCGFGFAPVRPEDREKSMQMMNRIEAIPLESMRQGMRWDWVTYPEFLDSLDKQGLGINIGSMFPFQPLRGWVLGAQEARERRSVTEKELNQMKQIFDEAMRAGAFGFSADKNLEDRPEDGSWLPSQVASEEEFLALAEVQRQFGVGLIGWTIGFSEPEDRAWQQELVTKMLRISGRPLHVGIPDDDEGNRWLNECRAEGLPLVSQEVIFNNVSEFKMAEYNLFDYMQSWVMPMIGTAEERAAKLRDPENRAKMKQDVIDNPHVRTDYEKIAVAQAMHERNHKYEGLSVAEIGKMEGKHPLDAWFDLALDENLQTEFTHYLVEASDDALAVRIKHPYTHISVSDGGAHTRYTTISSWPAYFLSHWIREKEVMTLEEAHYKMSALPAWLADFKDRGYLRKGAWADVIVYDPEKIGLMYDKPTFANDFPGEERRIIQKPLGLRYVVVNGGVTFEDNVCTGALPGKLMRSYDMVG